MLICVTNDHGYVPLVANSSRSFPHSRLITGFVTILTRRVPLEEQKLFTLPEHMSSPPIFSGVRVARSLVLYVCFVNRCLSLWSLVTQISYSDQPSHGDDRKRFQVMTSTLPKGTLGSVASLLAATLCQGHPDRNHKLWNIVSYERYILHMQVLLECCYI
jgi:hypothetical protein